MLNLKQNFKNKGFTLIELIVSLSIMVALFTIVVSGVASQRSNRNLNIAINELVTNIRKIQSNTLSSRGLSTTQPVQYYVIKFDTAKPTQYTIQAIYNVSSSPKLTDVQVVKFPPGIRLANTNPLNIYRSGYSINNASCALLAFKAPFAKIYTSTSCSPSAPTLPYNILTGDDYYNILNFVINGVNSANENTNLDIILTNDTNTKTRKVSVKAVSGLVTFQ